MVEGEAQPEDGFSGKSSMPRVVCTFTRENLKWSIAKVLELGDKLRSSFSV